MGLLRIYLLGILQKIESIMRVFTAFLFLSFFGSAQISLETTWLPKSTNETSGLEVFGDYLVTHNDSGDKPKLYILSQKGEKIMEIELNELTHKDWEDIAADSDYFYVADTGNNYATREDLKIYILDRHFFHQGTISIRYKAQTSFVKTFRNEFDAEALAVVGDQLHLFSKNRKTLQSEIYTFPKIAGNYTLTPRAVLDTQSLVTAADYSAEDDLMVMTGYNFEGDQFFYTIPNFRKNGYDNLELQKYLIPIKPAQIEAVKIISKEEYWLSSEDEGKNRPRLFRARLNVE